LGLSGGEGRRTTSAMGSRLYRGRKKGEEPARLFENFLKRRLTGVCLKGSTVYRPGGWYGKKGGGASGRYPKRHSRRYKFKRQAHQLLGKSWGKGGKRAPVSNTDLGGGSREDSRAAHFLQLSKGEKTRRRRNKSSVRLGKIQRKHRADRRELCRNTEWGSEVRGVDGGSVYVGGVQGGTTTNGHGELQSGITREPNGFKREK